MQWCPLNWDFKQVNKTVIRRKVFDEISDLTI